MLDQEQLKRAEHRPFKRDIVILWSSRVLPRYLVREECEASTAFPRGGIRIVYTPLERWTMSKAPLVNIVSGQSFEDLVESTASRPPDNIQMPPACAQELQVQVVRREDNVVTFLPPPSSTTEENGKRNEESGVPSATTECCEESGAPSTTTTEKKGKRKREEEAEAPSPPMTRSRSRAPPINRVTRSQSRKLCPPS